MPRAPIHWDSRALWVRRHIPPRSFTSCTLKTVSLLSLPSLCCLLPFARSAAAQDTRTVNEPAFPTTCTTLTALQAITSGEPTSETTFDTTRIQAALTACGTGKAVELTASGTNNAFLIAPLTIPTGVTLVVDAGVTVFGSRNPADYQIATAGVETCGTVGTKGNGCTNLITASNTTGAGVMGYGIVNGRGGDKLIVNGVTQTYSWWDLANNANTANGAQNNPILLYASRAPSFTLYKITLMNSPMFHVKYQTATGFTVWGIKIVAPYTARNTDGIDPDDNVTNMTVTNSYISDGDDDFAAGATAGNPVSNITFSNNHTYSGHGVSIGSYTAGGVSNVAVTNLNMAGNTSDTNSAGLKIKSSQDRGGLVNNVQYTNVCIQSERYPLQFNPIYNTNTGTSYPQYTNIGLHNVTITSLNNSTYQFQGLNATHLLGLTLDNLNIAGGVTATPVPQYASITLGPGPVRPVQLQQYAGTGVTYTGNITNPSEALYACPATNFPFLAGELFLSNATLTNQKSLSISNTASVTLNAVVEIVEAASSAPTSAIQFYEGTTQVGTGTLGGNGTLAQLTLSNLTSGVHTYTARYPADTAYAALNFGSVTVNVNTTATTTTMTATPASAVYGNPVALTATVSATTGTPTGSVSFQSPAGTVLGTAPLVGGVATFSTSTLPVGVDAVTAFFLGSTNFGASDTSASPVNVTITQAGTTTGVTAAPATAAYGSTITVNTTVTSATSGAPTGTVTIMDGTTVLGTATLSSATANSSTASFTTTALGAGVHNLTSVYGGDTNFTTSTSATAAKVTIFTSSTTTSLGFTSGTVPFGASVTMIATINAGTTTATTAGGNVVFTDNTSSNVLATIAVSSGQASYTTSSLPLGTNNITATYSGDSNYTGSSTTAPLVVTQAGTVTTLSASQSAPTFGSIESFYATVTPTSSGTPTGTVVFKDSGAVLGNGFLNAGGQYEYDTANLTAGTHSITATYSGDTNYTGSTSTALGITVGKAATQTTVSANPSSISYGSATTLTANVSSSGGNPTGSVSFTEGGTTYGSGTVDGTGKATLVIAKLTGGTHSIYASYLGDTNFAVSSSNTTQVNVAKVNTSATASANPTTFPYGSTTTLTVTFANSDVTGGVGFFLDNAAVGTSLVTISNGTASYTYATGSIPAGTHTLSATYGGDSNYNAIAQPISATITVSQTGSTTSVMAAPTTITFGASTVLTATVPTGATGTVTFKDGTATLGTGSVASGKASYTAASLAGGTHSITAVYGGDTNYIGSTSAAITVQVNTAATTVSITATPGTFSYGASTMLTATVSSTTATGSVTFKDGTTTLGTGTVTNGIASYTATALTGGSHSITAVYSGDTNYAGSTSSAVPVTVNTAATTTSVTANPATVTYGASTTLTATVSSTTATGSVVFKDGTTVLGSGTVTNGVASFNAASLGGGTHSITAVYSGDTNYATSTSNAITVTVNTATLPATLTATPLSAGFGTGINLTFTLSNNAATGTVLFKDGAATLGSGTVANGVATFTANALAVGSHSLTGTYSGDTNYSTVTPALRHRHHHARDHLFRRHGQSNQHHLRRLYPAHGDGFESRRHRQLPLP